MSWEDWQGVDWVDDIGGFEDIEDAREHVADLRERGWEARVISDDDGFWLVQRGKERLA